MRAAAACIALVMCAIAGCGPDSPPSIAQDADRLLQSLHDRGWFNGAVVLGHGDRELYARGFGPANIAAGAPFTPDTPADGGSIAKTFTAASILTLADEGRLRLDDRVQEHLPEYPHAATLVRHLLTHSAGLPEAEYDFFDDLVPKDQTRTTMRFLDVLRARHVAAAFEPGTRFRYSSLGFDVAALLVERISGKRWDVFLRERMLGPLGMEATFVRPAWFADWSGTRTLSYRRTGAGLVADDVFDNEGFYGGSNLYFSARDLHRWSRSFYTRPVLSGTALRSGTEAGVISEGPGRSGHLALNFLGWYYSELGRRYHYPGALQGFWSSAYRDEDRRFSVVYMSNNGMPQWLRPLLSRALIDMMSGRPPGAIESRSYLDLGDAGLDAAAGRYDVDGVGRLHIDVRDGRAFTRVGEGIEYPAFPVGDGQLYVPGRDVWIGFPRDVPVPFRQLEWLSIFHVAGGERL